MDAKLSQWVCSASDAICLKLVDETDDFHPVFTYTVFEEEKIFGYKDLRIKIYYSAGSLATYFAVEYSAKVNLENTRAEEINSKITPLLDEGYYDNYDSFMERVKADQTCFRPMGTKVGEYDLNGSVFELYQNKLSTPRFKEYHRRLQLFLIWYIEGSSFIEEDDDKWEIMLLFQKKINEIGDPIYSIVGYVTYYPFYYHPEQVRMRISQFFIMPPFQGVGHGTRLYSFIFDMFMNDKNIAQITVEDPNESFDDLRDRSDLKLLFKNNILKDASACISRQQLQEVSKRFKLSKRQTERCCEMILFKQLDKKNRGNVRRFRLFVKKRLFIRNKEVLEDLELAERFEKLEETYQAVIEDYRRILASLT